VTETGSVGAPNKSVAQVIAAYASTTGEIVNYPLTKDQAAAIRLWMIKSGSGMVLATEPVLQGLAFADVASKATWLQQAPCPTCQLMDPGSGPAVTSFPIPVRPFSKQVDEIRKQLTEKVRAEFVRTAGRREPIEAWEGISICATVVAIQARPAKVIDVDNTAKAIIDTMGGLVFPNDKQVIHISTYRLQSAVDPGYYLITLRPAHPPKENVIDHNNANVTFAGLIRPIVLE
jgi:Holliday junction resolvase RusA-like endonuclease